MIMIQPIYSAILDSIDPVLKDTILKTKTLENLELFQVSILQALLQAQGKSKTLIYQTSKRIYKL